MKNLITSFSDFVNESYKSIEEAEEGGKAKITPIGDTGISVVTFGENTSFSPPDNKPYILLLSGSVQFQSFVNNKTTTLTLERTDMEKPGAYKNVYTGKESEGGNRTMLVAGNTPDMEKSVTLIESIVSALYGGQTGVVNTDNISKVVNSLRTINKEYKKEISNNSLFTNLFANITKINNMKDPQNLVAAMGNKKTNYTQQVHEGIKKAFSTQV